MGEHHEMSPSKYPALMGCIEFERDDRNRPESDMGTSVHQEIENDINGIAEAEDYRARWACEQLRALAGESVIVPESKLMGTIGEVDGVFGTADAVFYDADGGMHIADFKTFSDGTTDYSMQLKGYAALSYRGVDGKVVFHVLHGGILKVETIESTMKMCHDEVCELIRRKRSGDGRPTINPFCRFCRKVAECRSTSGAVDLVSTSPVKFGMLSLPEKLVLLDAVDKLSESIREQAKKMAGLNGGKIEHLDKDGNVLIRYEMKPHNKPSKCEDICELASAMGSVVLMHKERSGAFSEVPCKGLTPDEMIKVCSISKSGLVEAIREKNKENNKVKKCDIEMWLKGYFKSEVGERFVRTV